MCCSANAAGGLGLTRCGLVCGLAALAALAAALLGPTWLVTEERFSHLHLGHPGDRVSVRFRLGLLKACHRVVKPANFTLCKYNSSYSHFSFFPSSSLLWQ